MKGLCQRIAQWCHKNGVVTKEEYPILIYGLQTIFNSSVKIAVILLLGACVNRIWGVLVSMTVFCSMRYWTGGYHSKSHLGCFTAMLIPCFLPSFLTDIKGSGVVVLFWVMGSLSLCMVLRYAPVNSRRNPVLDFKILCKNRICGILECVCLLGSAIIIHNTQMGWLILVPLFADGVLLLPGEAGKNVKACKEADGQ